MKIYLDTCCWGRPQDNPSVTRNVIEAVAVTNIVESRSIAGYVIVGSPLVMSELLENPKTDGRDADIRLYKKAVSAYAYPSMATLKRAEAFQSAGIGKKDSYHLSVAEAAGVGVLLTVDDDFEKIATNKELSAVRVMNPLKFLKEVFR